jgi:hypothetical protein
MKTKPNYEYGYIKVEPRGAGNFGLVSMSGIHYEDDSHLKDMVEDIKRHVDRVGNVEIHYDFYVCGECGSEYETKEDADNCCQPTNVKAEKIKSLKDKEV